MSWRKAVLTLIRVLRRRGELLHQLLAEHTRGFEEARVISNT